MTSSKPVIQHGNTIVQHFHGVKEKETGYAAYRAFQKAELMGVI